MKAVLCTAYGSPDVLKVGEVPTPTPKEGELLIKVHASVVTPSDCAFRKGDPFIVKLIYGLAKPKFSVFGVEFAGEVVAIGAGVTQFTVGNQVFGLSPDTFGAHAEYLCLPATKAVAIKPTNASYEQTVAICDGAPTALTFLRDVAKLKPGQRVLINGASGAVGAYGVQLAKFYGAEVTGVCSTANVDLVKSLGADHVIDYTTSDFTKTHSAYDVIFDAVGKSSFSACKEALADNGVYLTTVPTLGIVFQILKTSLFGSKKAKFATAGLMQNKENLNFITKLVEDGKLKPVIDRRYPLEQIAEAYSYVETGRKKGNVIITVAE